MFFSLRVLLQHAAAPVILLVLSVRGHWFCQNGYLMVPCSLRGRRLVLRDILSMPDLRINRISVPMLLAAGESYEVFFTAAAPMIFFCSYVRWKCAWRCALPLSYGQFYRSFEDQGCSDEASLSKVSFQSLENGEDRSKSGLSTSWRCGSLLSCHLRSI